MNNSIDAHIEFSFKGEVYSLSSHLDLDQLLKQHDAFPSIHAILAKEHGIDTYSYLYEVMLEAGVGFKNPQGRAADFLSDGDFDLPAFMAAHHEDTVIALLQQIAAREMGISDLNRHPELKNALVQAFNLGKYT